jgi:hypothetical protein
MDNFCLLGDVWNSLEKFSMASTWVGKDHPIHLVVKPRDVLNFTQYETSPSNDKTSDPKFQ